MLPGIPQTLHSAETYSNIHLELIMRTSGPEAWPIGCNVPCKCVQHRRAINMLRACHA